MENKIAIIKNGVVDSIIVATTEFGNTLPDITVDVTSIECAIGWSYDGANFVAPVKTTEEFEADAREWRDSELSSTDRIAQTPDYPNRDAILVYRQELRDWPSTDDFPETKPIKP
jgi:hypothetical protein